MSFDDSDNFDEQDPDYEDSDSDAYPFDDWKDMAFFGALSEEIAEEEKERLRIQKEFEKDTESESFDLEEPFKSSSQQNRKQYLKTKYDLRFAQSHIDKNMVLYLPYYLGRYECEPFEKLLEELDGIQKILENPSKTLIAFCDIFYCNFVSTKPHSVSTIHLVKAISNDI